MRRIRERYVHPEGGSVEEQKRILAEAVLKTGSAPLLVNIVANRIKQLDRGGVPLCDAPQGLNTAEIALREFNEGKIGYRSRILPA